MNYNLNKNLSKIYQNFLSEFITIFDKNELKELSLPLFMYAFPEYFESTNKILFVGKETYNWYGKMNETEKLNVKYLTGLYQEFEFAKNYHGKNSPFWRFLHTFYKRLNPESSRNGFLWTNFSKNDYKKATPTKRLQGKAIKGYKLIRDEINIIEPDIVIFLTGWGYDNKIREVYEGVEFDILEPRRLSKLKHEDLPELTFRTYHPNYLNLTRQFDDMIDKIELHCL